MALFTDGEMAVQTGLGYPKAFAKLCKNHSFNPYGHGPPFTFIPYSLQQIEENEFEEMFPILDPKAKPTVKPKIFANLLWKQLNHLGNAGFDPDTFRVDPYGNVLYYHADPASPLAWGIDHRFPCSRGGLTVASNLRILQWQVCKKKKNRLEFLIPWWDLQVGISITQFLSIFDSSNSDFRCRAFSWLFMEGENQELAGSQPVVSHLFPRHFVESKEKVGLAPAALVLTREEFNGTSLMSLDANRKPRSSSPIVAARMLRSNSAKENESENPYKTIVMARDSLLHKEAASKMQVEIHKLDSEVNELKQKAEDEKKAIQELELVLSKRRRRAEKCRRVAEAQSSHRTMIEKMIRETTHQSVLYKEQTRLNQAATSALMARLEAQKAICDLSEKELLKKFKERDELEKQIMHDFGCDQSRKRSRLIDDVSSSLIEEESRDHKPILQLQNGESHNDKAIVEVEKDEEMRKPILQLQNGESHKGIVEVEKEEEMRKHRGKGNVEKWLKLLMEKKEEQEDGSASNLQTSIENPIQENADCNGIQGKEEEIVVIELKNPPLLKNHKQEEEEESSHPIQENADSNHQNHHQPQQEQEEEEEEIVVNELNKTPLKRDYKEKEGRLSFDDADIKDGRLVKKEKKKLFARSESARVFRRSPSSPSIMDSMRKGVDFIRKKTTAMDDEEGDGNPVAARRSFIKSSIRSIKKAVKL